uniref:RING finger protein 11 n=2 Tax=Macaca TaxID=9539 RepID=A0A5F7ZET9_MACMU
AAPWRHRGAVESPPPDPRPAARPHLANRGGPLSVRTTPSLLSPPPDHEPPPPYQEQVPVPVYHPTPSQTRLATQLTEEEQIRIAQRIGLIQHLPKGVYDPGRDGSEKKIRECVICMMDFVYGDPIRFLPCMHIYHLDCIDDWLMRSFTCPSCMEPVDAALLSSYETN